ncbi:hypothetical protein CC2G_007701 [Coprinopsis cinerea AmutBmut pab1-1]|nr:hypothetical protein CC2G_007701 [Coprinopsis cinerea AmutBmut pab1-1]
MPTTTNILCFIHHANLFSFFSFVYMHACSCRNATSLDTLASPSDIVFATHHSLIVYPSLQSSPASSTLLLYRQLDRFSLHCTRGTRTLVARRTGLVSTPLEYRMEFG